MKLLLVVLPLVSAVEPYLAGLGEFCGKADNGDLHDCHQGLSCVGAKCMKSSGNLRGPTAPYSGTSHVVVHHVYHDAPSYGDHVYHDAPYYASSHHVVYHDEPSHVVYHDEPSHVVYHDAPSYTHVYHGAASPHYYSGAHHVVYHDVPSHHSVHYAPYHYATAPTQYKPAVPTPVLSSPLSWESVKTGDYTQEGQPCSGVTGLGANQKPCAPWLACYKQTSSGWFFGRAYGGHYGAATTGICKAKVVHLGQRCGRAKSKFAYIDVGRCPNWSHCQEDFYAYHAPGNKLGSGICTQNVLERVEDAVDPFHSAL